ncbi:MAG: hypothetical protein K8U57_36985 [Planctomycetes bacterium]|nr:hypothetical protein [Planctomycetota bacterium]
MPLVSNDPREFHDYANMQRMLPYHEAGHLLLAYYYGYQIGMYRCWDNRSDFYGSIKNRRTDAPPAQESLENICNEARKLFAGEAAARILFNLPNTDFVARLERPRSEDVTAATSFDDLRYATPLPTPDGIKILELYRINRASIPGSWWEWFWGMHDEAVALIQGNWRHVVALAERIQAVRPDAFDRTHGAMQGYRSGEDVLKWCEEVSAPQLNPEIKSISFRG